MEFGLHDRLVEIEVDLESDNIGNRATVVVNGQTLDGVGALINTVVHAIPIVIQGTGINRGIDIVKDILDKLLPWRRHRPAVQR